MQYKAIIFDFFDVIHSDPFQAWLSSHGLRMEDDLLEAANQVDRGDIKMAQFYAILASFTAQTNAEVQTEFEAAMRLDYEVVQLIEELRDSYKLAVLSNADNEFIRGIIHEYGLETLFEHVTISSEIGHIKPNPEIFQHTLRQLGVKPEQAIFIDDKPKNVKAAEKQGITGIVHKDSSNLRVALRDLGIRVTA